MNSASHEKRRASTSDIPDPKIRKTLEIGLNQSLEYAESKANHTIFDSTIPTQYSWNELPKGPLNEERNTLVQLKGQSQPFAIKCCTTSRKINIRTSRLMKTSHMTQVKSVFPQAAHRATLLPLRQISNSCIICCFTFLFLGNTTISSSVKYESEPSKHKSWFE